MAKQKSFFFSFLWMILDKVSPFEAYIFFFHVIKENLVLRMLISSCESRRSWSRQITLSGLCDSLVYLILLPSAPLYISFNFFMCFTKKKLDPCTRRQKAYKQKERKKYFPYVFPHIGWFRNSKWIKKKYVRNERNIYFSRAYNMRPFMYHFYCGR